MLNEVKIINFVQRGPIEHAGLLFLRKSILRNIPFAASTYFDELADCLPALEPQGDGGLILISPELGQPLLNHLGC